MRRRSAINLKSPIWGLLGVAVALGIYQLGVVTGKRQQRPSLTDEVVRILRSEYYKPVSARRLERHSVEAAVAALGDPFTAYLDPSELAARRSDTDGVYTGVGIGLGRRDGGLTVTRVYADSPAAKGGVLAGDALLAVDGRPVERITDIPGRIKGREGTKVVLRLRTGEAEPRDVTLTRSQVTIPAVEKDLIRDGGAPVGRISLLEFDRGAGGQLDRAARSLIADGAQSLVLDLRGDPGGLVQEAVRSASVFLPKGSVLATTDGAHQERKTLKATGGALQRQTPLVVLVDGNSASSSEILAGALRDNGRAALVGARTFGKARIQLTRQLSNGGGLVYTVSSYLTPKGLDIGQRGLLPEIAALDDPGTVVDEALAVAVARARGVRPDLVAASPALGA